MEDGKLKSPPFDAADTHTEVSGLSTDELYRKAIDAMARNRERNRLHARRSRQRRKITLEIMRAEATALQTEQKELMQQYKKRFHEDFKPKLAALRVDEPDGTFAEVDSVLALAGVDGAGSVSDTDSPDGSKDSGTPVDGDERVERARLRNRLHARKSRLRKKALLSCLKQTIDALKINVHELHQALAIDGAPVASRSGTPASAWMEHPGPSDYDLDGLDGDDSDSTEDSSESEDEELKPEPDMSARGRIRKKPQAQADFDMKNYGKGSRGGKGSRLAKIAARQTHEVLPVAGTKRPRNGSASETSNESRKRRVDVKVDESARHRKDTQDRDDAAHLLVMLGGQRAEDDYFAPKS